MRISEDFILRRVADEYLLIPVGEAAHRIKGMIGMSESGAWLYEQIRNGCTGKGALVEQMLNRYEVDEKTAQMDVNEFFGKMRSLGILLED